MLTTALWGRFALVMGRCPGHIKDGRGITSRFSHVIDIYEAAGITPPKIMDGVEQKPLECTSLARKDGWCRTEPRRVQVGVVQHQRGLQSG